METEERCKSCGDKSDMWLAFTIIGTIASVFLLFTIWGIVDSILDYKAKVLFIENATGVCNNVIDLFRDKGGE